MKLISSKIVLKEQVQIEGWTLFNFSKEFAFLGSHPFTASPATETNQEGQPAAACSLANPLGTFTIPAVSSILFETPSLSEPSLFAPASNVSGLWCTPTFLFPSAKVATFLSLSSGNRGKMAASLQSYTLAYCHSFHWLQHRGWQLQPYLSLNGLLLCDILIWISTLGTDAAHKQKCGATSNLSPEAGFHDMMPSFLELKQRDTQRMSTKYLRTLILRCHNNLDLASISEHHDPKRREREVKSLFDPLKSGRDFWLPPFSVFRLQSTIGNSSLSARAA